jgi:toluene monooxygenase system protein D
MAVIDVHDTSSVGHDLVGPVIRSGPLAEAIIDAVADDNPGRDVIVVDRGDYLRIHTARTCRLTRASLERHLGQPMALAALEIDMPSFMGRLRTRVDEYVWFYDTQLDSDDGTGR